MVDAGRILIMPKGIWSNLVSYEMLDVVTQDNIAYLARQSSVGVSPKNDSSYTYWQPFGTSVTPDGETIIMDSTDNLAVNLDNKSLIYNDNITVNIDNKSLKCTDNLAVNIDNKSLVYDDTNMYVKVAIDGSTIKYDSVHGYLYVDASNFNINDLNNIAITSPADGQTLVYDSATQKWKNGQGQSSISSVISDAWNASTTYAVGQYCIYNNSLWKCLVQHSGQTPTEGTYWTNVTVANEITSVNNSLSGIGTFELLASPTANGTVTVKNMSNYRYIYLEMDYTGTELAFDASMIPYGIFKLKKKYKLQCFGASQSYKFTMQGDIQYVSDTSINIILNDQTNLRPKIYGIK